MDILQVTYLPYLTGSQIQATHLPKYHSCTPKALYADVKDTHQGHSAQLALLGAYPLLPIALQLP